MKRAARSIRSGSSLKLISGASGVRSTLAQQVDGAAERIDERRASPPPVTSSAIALTVKSRRLRSVSISSAYVTCGLRESSVYDSARNVVISYGAVALLGADRAEPLALRPHRVGPAVEAGLDRVGAGVGGEVEVEVLARVVDQQVADAATDQVQAVPGGAEPVGERRQLGEHGGEAVGDHGPARLTSHPGGRPGPFAHAGTGRPAPGYRRER